MPTPMEVLRQQAGGAGNSFQFNQYGDRVALQIVNYKVTQQEKGRKGSGEWEDVLVLTGPNLLRGGENTDLFVGGSRATSLFEAMTAVGATDLQVGAIVDMTYVAERDTGNIQKMKLYQTTYQAPAPAAGSGFQSFQQGQQPQQAPQGPPPQQYQAPPAQQGYPAPPPQGPPPQQGYPQGPPPQQYPQQAPPPAPQQGYPQQGPPQGTDPATLFGTAPPQ